MSDNEQCDVPETPTENRSSDTETVQLRPGRMDMPGMTLPRQIKRLIVHRDYVSQRFFCALMNVCRTEL